MDLIGHLKVLEEAKLAGDSTLQGEEILYAMFPNLAHCHEWAYKSLWEVHRSDDQNLRLIQGHMICDYVIHYGPVLTEPKERIGWAYREMPKAVAVMHEFFDHVTKSGFVESDPRLYDTPEHLERDFGHTAVECALDFVLAKSFDNGVDRLGAIREAFEKLNHPEFGEKFIQDVFNKASGYTREPQERIKRTIEEYGRWVQQAKSPVEFAALTMLSKYNIVESKEALSYCLEFLESLANSLDPDALNHMIQEIVERIANPDLALVGSGI